MCSLWLQKLKSHLQKRQAFLELMAEVLRLRLLRKVSELLEVPFENCTLWTDSEDVIWLNSGSV